MEFFYPIISRGNQERANLVFLVIKYSCAPFLMLALFHIAVFVATGTVEFIQAEAVLWEMSRYPVKNNSDSRLVTAVNKIHQILGHTVS